MPDVLTSLLAKTALSTEFTESADASDVLVVMAVQVDDAARIISSSLSAEDVADIEARLARIGFTGAKDTFARLDAVSTGNGSALAVVGHGSVSEDNLPTVRLRHAAGVAGRLLKQSESVTLEFTTGDAAQAQALLEGAVLGAYEFTVHKSSPKAARLTTVRVHAPAVSAEERKAVLARAAVLTEAVAMTRDLVNTSPLHLYPESFADFASRAAEGTGVDVTVTDDAELAAQGYGGLTAVGMGSTRGPRLVRVAYTPADATKTLGLVGKGITFDTGGISIKPGPGMQEMKSDMAGAATVLSVVLAAAKLKLNVGVVGYLAIAENMPSGGAGRPGDVITMFGGKTVEVLNTDAEGRLVMGDALVAASAEEPDVLIDIATLTGAALIALGKRTAGVMGDDTVCGALTEAAGHADELLWHMPIPDEARGSMDSAQADLANIGSREGGMLVAAAFLREFVGQKDGQTIPWAHIDIAGPSFNSGSPYGYITKEGTGYGVRTLLEYARTLEA